jgi:hypothetical protein
MSRLETMRASKKRTGNGQETNEIERTIDLLDVVLFMKVSKSLGKSSRRKLAQKRIAAT